MKLKEEMLSNDLMAETVNTLEKKIQIYEAENENLKLEIATLTKSYLQVEEKLNACLAQSALEKAESTKEMKDLQSRNIVLEKIAQDFEEFKRQSKESSQKSEMEMIQLRQKHKQEVSILTAQEKTATQSKKRRGENYIQEFQNQMNILRSLFDVVDSCFGGFVSPGIIKCKECRINLGTKGHKWNDNFALHVFNCHGKSTYCLICKEDLKRKSVNTFHHFCNDLRPCGARICRMFNADNLFLRYKH